jgi:hypothetical protein
MGLHADDLGLCRCGGGRRPPLRHYGHHRQVVATTGSLPNGATARRGHAKSSARPAGTGIASPFTSTFEATASVTAGRGFPPSRSEHFFDICDVAHTRHLNCRVQTFALSRWVGHRRRAGCCLAHRRHLSVNLIGGVRANYNCSSGLAVHRSSITCVPCRLPRVWGQWGSLLSVRKGNGNETSKKEPLGDLPLYGSACRCRRSRSLQSFFSFQ